MFDHLRSRGRATGLLPNLVVLVLLVLVPSLALGGITLAELATTYRRSFEQQLEAIARSVAVTLDHTLDVDLALATALASSDHLRRGDIPAFEAEARAAGEALGTWILLVAAGPDYRRLVNTALATGIQPNYGGLALPSEQAPIPRVFATGQPTVTNVGQSILLGRRTALILAPVLRDGTVTHVVAVGFEPRRVAEILARHDLAAPFAATIVDGRGRIIAASTDHERLAGAPALSWMVAPHGHDGHDLIQGETSSGEEVLASVVPLRRANWLAVVSTPADATAAAILRPILVLGIGGFLCLAAAAALAVAFARRISRPIGQLAEAVSQPDKSSVALLQVPPAKMTEVEVLREALIVAAIMTEEQRERERDDAARQQLLTAELSHRVKNALSVVLAALRLTPKHNHASYFKAVEGRVSALARANTALAESEWRGGDLRSLIDSELGAFQAIGAGPRVTLEGSTIPLAAVAVQPLAIAVHELATNAVKHGALSIPEGHLWVRWSSEHSGDLVIVWEELNGRSEPPTRSGFGGRVLDATIRTQLSGTIEREWRPDGLRAIIRLPARISSAAAQERGS
jgi:two-component sensor histidine kinase